MNNVECGKDTIDKYGYQVGGTISDITGITTITSPISSNTVWANPVGQNTADEPSEGDIFKQIVSLLGIKIANVKIEGGRVTIYGYRKKKKYIIEISGDSIVVKNEKGDQISEIMLLGTNSWNPGTITINTPYIVYPQPGTSPNIYPYTQPYTTTTSGDTFTITGVDLSTGTYTIDANSNIIENKVEIDG
jgi:hypothetical protein